MPAPSEPKGPFNLKGVGKRYTVRQGLTTAGREVEILVVDRADQKVQDIAAAALTALQPLPLLVTMGITFKAPIPGLDTALGDLPKAAEAAWSQACWHTTC